LTHFPVGQLLGLLTLLILLLLLRWLLGQSGAVQHENRRR
jgi:hypothetical protein